jgi:hypothetical protein
MEVERFKHRQLAPTVGHRHDHRRIRRTFTSKINLLVACVRIAHEQLSVICRDQVRDGINFEASNGVLLHVSPLVLAALSS